MNNPKLPAGLEDKNLEIYARDNMPKAVYKGKTIDYVELPCSIREVFQAELISDQAARTSLRDEMGIFDSDDQEAQFVMCRYGGFDKKPDLCQGKTKPEYWDCGRRTKCPGEGKICRLPEGPNGRLTPREFAVTRLVAFGKLDKEIAYLLNIEITTARTYVKRIREKLEVNNRIEVARWAEENGLV